MGRETFIAVVSILFYTAVDIRPPLTFSTLTISLNVRPIIAANGAVCGACHGINTAV